MIALAPRAVDEAETVEDLKGAALQAVGLAVEDLGASFVDDAGADAETGEPGGEHEAGGLWWR